MVSRERFSAALVVLSLTLIGCARPAVPVRSDAAARTGEPAPPATAFAATVDRVVDGDTVIAQRSGVRTKLRVRLIGLDSPETVKPGTPVQCFGAESSAYLRDLLQGRDVTAAYEGGGHLDRFGRELWDIWLPDGTFVAGQEVALGYARALRVRPQVEHAAYLSRQQSAARAARRGLWKACSQ
jgi:micrococcal nuclease